MRLENKLGTADLAERQHYIHMQQIAKMTIEYIKETVKPGMNLREIRRLCEDKMLELGADSFCIGMSAHLFLRGMKLLFLYRVRSM